ncbi:PucR family transcriptional regulator [Nonomuraea purpurea]|uniref:PucR family transcriptional regulator n=1 Tax=Nonomuraea purpurea TaxID=1849276 RepID=A0ABV8GGW9_9ACTN
MGELFESLREQVDDSAREAVSAYLREIPEYGQTPIVAAKRDDQAGMLGFAVFIRSRSFALAPAGLPLGEQDLSTISSAGRRRAELGLTVLAQHRVLGLHTRLMLQEIHRAAGPDDGDDLLRMVGWFGAQGVRAKRAYLHGYADGVSRSRRLAARAELLARTLLADEPLEPMQPVEPRLEALVAPRYVVSVLRIPNPPVPEQTRSAMVEAILDTPKPAALPAWLEPGELALLTPGDRSAALRHLRSATAVLGRACQVACAPGESGRLAETLTLARKAALVAPLEERPARLHAVADLFVEMAVANAPEIDAWLAAFARRLADGPDLVSTLHAYYRHDMNRVAASAALGIHPRTLDYRLQRARKVTGLSPGSTLGVRMLSTAVARLLARESPW